MTDYKHGPDWVQRSDGKWYPPQQTPPAPQFVLAGTSATAVIDCPHCRYQIPADARVCAHCGAVRKGAHWKPAREVRKSDLMAVLLVFTVILIIGSFVLALVATSLAGPKPVSRFSSISACIGPPPC